MVQITAGDTWLLIPTILLKSHYQVWARSWCTYSHSFSSSLDFAFFVFSLMNIVLCQLSLFVFCSQKAVWKHSFIRKHTSCIWEFALKPWALLSFVWQQSYFLHCTYCTRFWDIIQYQSGRFKIDWGSVLDQFFSECSFPNDQWETLKSFFSQHLIKAFKSRTGILKYYFLWTFCCFPLISYL